MYLSIIHTPKLVCINRILIYICIILYICFCIEYIIFNTIFFDADPQVSSNSNIPDNNPQNSNSQGNNPQGDPQGNPQGN